MKDMFGNEVTVAQAKALLKKRGTTQPKGYAAPPGTGPTGETCKTCKHIARIQHSKVYRKCRLMRANWTGGAATDIKAKWPACRLWEKSE